MDYTTLVASKSTAGSIKQWVNYDKPPSEVILAEAETWIYGSLRCREMRTSAYGTIYEGEEASTLPSRFLDPIALRLRIGADVMPVTEADINRYRVYDGSDLVEGMPSYFGIYNEQLVYEVAADQAYDYDLVYYAQPQPLSESNLTNFLTQRYPLILRFACTGFAASFMKDYEEMERNLKIAEGMIAQASSHDDMSRRGMVR